MAVYIDGRRHGNREEFHKQKNQFSLNVKMTRLTRDGTAETASRDQICQARTGQGNIHFPCSADHEHSWRPYPGGLYSAIIGNDRVSCTTMCVCVCFLPIHSGHQVRWTYQPGSHRRKVTQDF